MLVAQSARFGAGSPYGHPALGLLSKADAIKLDDVRRFWQGSFRPDRATLVVTGQITRAEVEALVKKSLSDWKAAGDPWPAPRAEPPPEAPRLVLVDRPKAVQSVLVVARDGVRADADEAAPLELVNTALGGSFTSRLNENLREDKGWTYGAGSTFQKTRAPGLFYARTSVDAKFTGPAVREILKELSLMADKGLSPEEVEKTKAQDRADLVSSYETTSGTGAELASLVALGLPPNHAVTSAERRQSATVESLARLAREHVDPSKATIVIVGDESVVRTQLAEAGLGEPTLYSVEGFPAKSSKSEKSPADAPKTDKPKVAPATNGKPPGKPAADPKVPPKKTR
jgi:predicted Zn-dependent peptidase